MFISTGGRRSWRIDLQDEDRSLWEIPDRIKELKFYVPPAPCPEVRCLDFSPYANHLGMRDHVELSGYEYLVADLEPKEDGVLKEDICALSFEDASFELIICSHILEHVKENLGALRQIHRVLAKDGICLFSAPCAFSDETRPIKPEKKNHFHVWRYGYRELREILLQVGFSIGLEVIRPVKAEASYLAVLHKGLPGGLFVGSLGMTKKIQDQKANRLMASHAGFEEGS